jgi:hypothetical protein
VAFVVVLDHSPEKGVGAKLAAVEGQEAGEPEPELEPEEQVTQKVKQQQEQEGGRAQREGKEENDESSTQAALDQGRPPANPDTGKGATVEEGSVEGAEDVPGSRTWHVAGGGDGCRGGASGGEDPGE